LGGEEEVGGSDALLTRDVGFAVFAHLPALRPKRIRKRKREEKSGTD